MAFESTYAGATNQPQNNFGGNTQPSFGVSQYGTPQQMGYGQPIPQQQAGMPVPAQAQPQQAMPQAQPVQQQMQAQPQVPASYGTTVDRVVVNKQWASGSKSWMAVVDITTDAELFLNGLNAWVNPDGVNIVYPGEDRMQNGQPVLNQQGKKMVNHYYTPLFVKGSYNGYAEMSKILAPLAQSAVQTGQGVSDNPSDMGHSNKMFPAPQTGQGAPRAYGSAYVKSMPTRIYGVFVMPVYDENGTCTCRLAMPSRPKMKNGQPVMKDGKQEYTQYVILGKSSREEVTNIVGQAVYDALMKAQQQIQ